MEKFKNALILFSLISSNIFAEGQLNYIQASLLRLSSKDRVEEWILPFYRKEPVTIRDKKYQVKNNLFFAGNEDLLDLYDDIRSDNKERMQEALNDSYGDPKDIAFKVSTQWDFGKFKQGLSLNAAEVLLFQNPIFPEVESLLFYDLFLTSSYEWTFNEYFYFVPKISFGPRKALNKTITSNDLISGNTAMNISKSSTIWNVELGFEANYHTKYGDFLFELNSLPLQTNALSYWDTNIGYRTLNLLEMMKIPFFHSWDFYTLYSPFYGGDYDVKQTFRFGSGLFLSQHLGLDFFLNTDLDPMTIIKVRVENIDLSFFTFVKYYDDYSYQKSRSYGLNLRVQF